MIKRSFFVGVVALVFFLSCTKEQADYRLPGFDTPVITGYHMRDPNGWEMGIIGTANVKLSDSDSPLTSRYSILIYPNPCITTFNMHIVAPENNQIKKLWITRANISGNLSNSSVYLNMNAINIGGFPVFQTDFTSEQISIDVSKFEDGFYRVYLKTGGFILYDNLVINQSIQ